MVHAAEAIGKTYSKKDEKGRYCNPLPTDPHSTGSMPLLILKFLFRKDGLAKPDIEIPVNRLSAELFGQPASLSPVVYWLGHSSLLLETGGMRYLIDPVFCERASFVQWLGPIRLHPCPIAAEDIPELDAIIISHNHYDHMDETTLRTLATRARRFFVPLGLGALLQEWGVPAASITEMDWWQEVQHGPNTIVATPARHFTGRALHRGDSMRTLWAGWCFINARHRVFYSGDSGEMPQFSEIGAHYGPFDLTMIGIGAYDPAWADIHTSPAQAVEAHLQVRGDKLLPVHWATFDLALHSWGWPIQEVVKEAARHNIHLLTPQVGERVDPKTFVSKQWWSDKEATGPRG